MVKLFTHTDLDGIGCAILAKLAYGNEVDISYCNYDDINEKVDYFYSHGGRETECHITDISVSERLAQDIDNASVNILLLDHHGTATYLNKYPWCVVMEVNPITHIKTCGTELYYEELVAMNILQKTDILDQFVELVRDYDTWRWATLGEKGLISKQLNDLLYIYGREKFIEKLVVLLEHDSSLVFDEIDITLLEYRQRDIDSYIEAKNKEIRVKEFAIDDCMAKCGVIFCERYHSELGNRLSEAHPELDFIILLGTDGKMSFRTVKDDLNLGEKVAKLFGGGGHPKAAGAYFSTELVEKLISDILTVPKKKKKEEHPHQEWVNFVKMSGDSIKENAESIVGSEKILKDLTVTIRLYSNEMPEIDVDRTFFPEGLLKR